MQNPSEPIPVPVIIPTSRNCWPDPGSPILSGPPSGFEMFPNDDYYPSSTIPSKLDHLRRIPLSEAKWLQTVQLDD